MIPKYSVKRPYTVLVAVVLVIVDEDDNRSAAGNESAVCDRCHNRCGGKSGGSGKGCDIANRSGNGNDFQY